MCGIAAALGHPNGDAIVRRMLHAIAHRGPDEQAVYSDGDAALGICRLSILGGDHGRQPYVITAGRQVCVFNGEIYNFRHIPDQASGTFSAHARHSDTAAFAELISNEGLSSLSKLDGMFAAILANPDHLILVRDHPGIKPLYYTVCAETGAWLMCSEVKGLIAAAGRAVAIDAASMSDIAVLGFPLENATLFEGFQSVPAGTAIIVDKATRQIARTLTFQPRTSPAGGGDIVDLLRNRLADSIALQTALPSPPALSLSGGLDSTVMAAIYADVSGIAPPAFVVAPDGPHPDKDAAKAIARAGLVSLQHVTLSVNGVISRLAKLVWAIESPFGLPAMPQLLVAEAVQAAGHRVVMTGEGADELFCGYDAHVRDDRRVAAIQSALHRARALSSVRPSLARVVDDLASQTEAAHYSASIRSLFLADQLQFNHMAVSDRLFMAASVECRVPYLGAEVVGLASTLSIDDVIDRSTGERKVPLRRLARRMGGVCASVADRPKIGFPAAATRISDVLKTLLRGYRMVHTGLTPALRPMTGVDALIWDVFIEIFLRNGGMAPGNSLVRDLIGNGLQRHQAGLLTERYGSADHSLRQ